MRILHVGSVCLLFICLVACVAPTATGVPVRPTLAGPPGLDFPRQTPPEGLRAEMAALLYGELVENDGCLYVVTDYDERFTPIWPHDFSAAVAGGAIQVLDGAGTVVARTGDWIRLSGGETGMNLPADMLAPTACPGRYWVVGSEVAGIRGDDLPHHPAIAPLLAALTQPGVVLAAPEQSHAIFLYPEVGIVYPVGEGKLHIHLFPTAQIAQVRAAAMAHHELPDSSVDWVAPPHFFRCDAVIALYLGTDTAVLDVLTEHCGAAFFTTPLAAESVSLEATVPFTVCQTFEDWTRPTAEEQKAVIWSLPRYRKVPWEQRYWAFQRNFYRYHGGSSELSSWGEMGLWNIADSASCVSAGQPAILAGRELQLWVLNQQVQTVQRVGDVYTVTVSPARGFQIVQLPGLGRPLEKTEHDPTVIYFVDDAGNLMGRLPNYPPWVDSAGLDMLTLTPTAERPFPQTEALWYAEYVDPHAPEVLRTQREETLALELTAYLNKFMSPDKLGQSADELSQSARTRAAQTVALAQLTHALPIAGGQVISLDLDPLATHELVIMSQMLGGFSFYARYTATDWALLPIPLVDEALALSTFPYTITTRAMTGNNVPELLTTHHSVGGSNYRIYLQVLRLTEADLGPSFLAALFRAELVFWAEESTYTLEPDPTQTGKTQIVLSYPRLYALGFDDKMLPHPRAQQIWRWDADTGHFMLAVEHVELARAVYATDSYITLTDHLRWWVNEGETAFRQGQYAEALAGYEKVIAMAEAEAWEPTVRKNWGAAQKEPHWSAYAEFRRAETLFLLGQEAVAVPAMQAVAETWEGDLLGDLARAFLTGYGDGGADAAQRGIQEMRQTVDLEEHLYYSRPGTLRFPLDAEGILFSGIAPVFHAPDWVVVGTFER